VCIHATLSGRMHITKQVHWPQLHVSSSAGWTTRWPPMQDWQYLFKIWTFPRAIKLQLRATFDLRATRCTPLKYGISYLVINLLTITCQRLQPQCCVVLSQPKRESNQRPLPQQSLKFPARPCSLYYCYHKLSVSSPIHYSIAFPFH